MAVNVNGTAISNFKEVYFNGTRIDTVYVNGTKVYGIGSNWTTVWTAGMAPDSNYLEGTTVPLCQANSQAFTSQGYTQGPGTDSVYRVVLAYGYRLVTSDGTWGEGQAVNLYEGRTVTGANTSHNGGTSVSLQVNNFT